MEKLNIISVIKTSEEYDKILHEIEELMNNVEPDTIEGDRLELLILLTTDYEDKNYPIEAPDPIEAIKFKMEESGLRQKDLVDIMGAESRVSEILNRKRKLTIDMIRGISSKLNISLSTLVQDYQLVD